jgi:O-acetyl-ADP-ribose deacetylase (regulator of RNase III)
VEIQSVKVQFGRHRIELVRGDITTQQVDAVVNAANSALAGGGGVDGAIHRAAGPSVMEETRRRYPRGCPTGEAVVTAAGHLPARFIFHAVGPVWQGGHRGEPDLLRSAYRRCLELAIAHDCRSVAFPAISTGIYGYPMDLAAETALEEIRRFLVEQATAAPLTVRMVLFDAGAYAAFARVLESYVADESHAADQSHGADQSHAAG